MKTSMSEMENFMCKINGRLNIEEKISELEDIK